MKSLLLMCGLAFCAASMSACAEPQMSVGHDVKLESEVIIGSKDARHELILYLSPGDLQSIGLFMTRYPELKSQYVDNGKLRVVVREVPELIYPLRDPDGRLTRYEAALTYSAELSTHLRCAYHYHGSEGYETTWNMIGISVARSVRQHGDKLWPYFESQASADTVFLNMMKDGVISEAEYEACTRRSLQKEFDDKFERYSELLKDRHGVDLAPAVFLNGEQIEVTRKYRFNELMLALKENLELEYSLSRD